MADHTPAMRMRVIYTQTEAAAERIRELLASKPDAVAIRLGVRTRTCGRSVLFRHQRGPTNDGV